MSKNLVFLLPIVLWFFTGCAPLVVGGAAAGTAAGTYYFVEGALRTDYKYSFDNVWQACEKTLADMHALDVRPVKEIGQGVLYATINGVKVQIDVTYKERDVTMVAIRVGLMGDKVAAQMLHDKIEDNIAKE